MSRPLEVAAELILAIAVGAVPASSSPAELSGRNTHVQLSVTDVQLVKELPGSAAPLGQQFAVVGTAWKNLTAPKQVERPKSKGRSAVVGGSAEIETAVVETPYMIPAVPDSLYLLVDGRYLAEVNPATAQLEGALPVGSLLIERHGQEVRGPVAFAIPEGSPQSLALQFFDFAQGHIQVPLRGKAPAGADRPIFGPKRNQLIEAAVYRTETLRKLGDAEAPSGRRWLVVDLGAASVAAGAATQIDLDQYAYLVEDGVYQSQPAKDLAGVPYRLQGLTRFIPGFTRRGTIVFAVPEQAGSLELLFSASSMDPLSFPLTPDRRPAAQPKPARTIQDGDVAEILINGWRSAEQIGDATPAGGGRFQVLDVTVWNKAPRADVIAQPGQFVLLAGKKEIDASPATAALPHGLAGERTVPGGTRSRFEIAFEPPAGAKGLRLRYQGFTRIEEIAHP